MVTKKKVAKKRGNVGGSVGPSRELSRRAPGQMVGSIANDILNNRQLDTASVVRLAAAAEKSEAGTVLRLQYSLEHLFEIVSNSANCGCGEAVGVIDFGFGPRSTLRRPGFVVVFSKNAHSSMQFRAKVHEIYAYTPKTALVEKVDVSNFVHNGVMPDGVQMLKMYDALRPAAVYEGPWWPLLETELIAFRRDLEIQLEGDNRLAKEKREAEEKQAQDFAEAFRREHGL